MFGKPQMALIIRRGIQKVPSTIKKKLARTLIYIVYDQNTTRQGLGSEGIQHIKYLS